MSPDNVFAAQMWGWPDAVIKRDAHGAVMFVNATFLSLYGGSIEDWQGMAVTGWSAPPAPGQAQRFETRIPGADASETVYDWLEAAGPDGTALAIARDVTPLMPRPGDVMVTAHTQVMTPPVEQIPAIAASSFEAVMQDAPTHAPAVQAPAAHAPVADASVAQDPTQMVTPDYVHETPVYEPPVALTPAVGTPPIAESAATAQPFEAAPAIEHTDFIPPVEIAAPIPAAPAEPAIAQVASVDPVIETVVEDEPAPRVERREFERRALPIEDESAVLGNNWRDAVIAKAVGAQEAAVDKDEDSDAPEPSAIRKKPEVIRILLAEDNAINALLTRTLLEAEGCQVDTVEDGELAVEAMKVNAYDLIFMDMRMPNMDGLEATRKIRQMDHASKGLPIVALTANAFDDDRNACFDAGMNDFMTKPVSAEELSEMVAQWTGEQDEEEKIAS